MRVFARWAGSGGARGGRLGLRDSCEAASMARMPFALGSADKAIVGASVAPSIVAEAHSMPPVSRSSHSVCPIAAKHKNENAFRYPAIERTVRQMHPCARRTRMHACANRVHPCENRVEL